MSPKVFVFVSLVASLLLIAQALQKQTGSETFPSAIQQDDTVSLARATQHAIDFSRAENDFLWTSVDCASENDASPLLARRVVEFENQSLKALVAAVCAGCAQKIVTETFIYERHLEDSLEQCAVVGGGDLMARVALAYALLLNASHHREMLVAGEDPRRFYTLSDASVFSPTYGTTTAGSAKFFLGRVASVDFVSQHAIDTEQGLDEAYHFAHLATDSMKRFIVEQEHMRVSDLEALRAKAVIQALIEHMATVQKALHDHGATSSVSSSSKADPSRAHAKSVGGTSDWLEGETSQEELTTEPVTDSTKAASASSNRAIATLVTGLFGQLLSYFGQWLNFCLTHFPEEDFQATSSRAQVIVERSLTPETPPVGSQFAWSSVDCAFVGVAAIQLEVRVKRFEENTLATVIDAICTTCSQKNVTDALKYAEELQDSLRECSIPGSEVLVARVQAVFIDLLNASHHREIVAAGKGTDPMYVVDNSAEFTPPVHSSPRQLADWYMGKVASIDFLTQKAINTNAHIDEVFHSCHRLQLSMVHFLSFRDDMDKKDFGTFRAKKVIRELQVYVTQLEDLLRNHGAHSIVEGSLSEEPEENLLSPLREPVFEVWTEVECTPRADAEGTLEQRVQELENVSLLSLLETVCVKCSQKSVTATFAFARHLQNAISKCRIPSGKHLRNQVDAIIDELAQASHHRVLVSSGKDPRGLYAISEDSAFTPKDGTPLAQAAQFFIGKVTSIDFMTREAIDQDEGLSRALVFAHRLYLSMTRFLSLGEKMVGDGFTVARAQAVIESLQSYLMDLQNLLREHGAVLGDYE